MKHRTESDDRDYVKPGMRLRLPRDYSTSELPDWRATLFTLVLPFPASGLPPARTAQRFVDLPPSWLPGRFRGIQTIETAVDVDGTYRAPDWNRQGDGVYAYTPRTFHETATARFTGPLAESVGAAAVDRDVPGLNRSGSTTTSNPLREDLRCHRYLFSADTYSTVSPKHGDTPASGQPEKPVSVFMLDEEPVDGSSVSSRASVRLVCAEFLQYRGMLTHRDVSTPDESGGEKVHSVPGELAHDYLVLHILAENCSSSSLEQVSQSLHRSRRRITVKSPGQTAERTPGETQDVRLLDRFIADAVNALNDGAPDSDRFIASVGKSGEIAGGSKVTFAEPTVIRHPGERPVRLWRSGVSRRPVRVVCAVPGKDLDAHPALFQDPGEDSEWGWCLQDTWAWALGSGADQFAEGIPRYSSATPDNPDRSAFEYWTMVPTHHGAALVRNCPADVHDSNPWMLSGTRLIDLAILIHRASTMLGNIGERLRSITLASSELRGSEDGDQSLDDAVADLSAALKKFRDIQSDFVRFRDRLWFEVVPGRDLDTEFMLSLRESLGVTRRYLDVKDELSLREAVYSVQFNQRQVDLDRQLQRQAAEEAQARENERDRRNHRQSQQDSLQNKTLAFLAIVFAIPGLIQLLPPERSLPLFLGTTAVIVVIIVAALYVVRRHQKSNTGTPHADAVRSTR
ncbi:hypothetical protein [uncultured Corynebacterium sp.]|uniref:hypothetical protein n=1 Tax=uncultured Corynebacterium sp. TaxID=159447 RepID=UPI0025EF2F36|nr:hypothetical protein [uncultured Corynebacterium sp.]